MADLRNIRFKVSYDGTDFKGSQRQRNSRTVQEDLESALSQVTSDTVSVTLAGRTDQGVHAIGQVANARVHWSRTLEALKTGVNALTRHDLTVREPEEVDSEFHARFSAMWRRYRYRYWFGPAVPAFGHRYVWHQRKHVDVDQMKAAIGVLCGEIDFASFAGDGLGVPWGHSATKRRVDYATVREIDGEFFGTSALNGTLVEFEIQANAFLPHMVRNLAGVLADIGIGRRDEHWLSQLLNTRDRRETGPPAPSRGLVLWEVGYPTTVGAA